MTDNYLCEYNGNICPYKNNDTTCPMPGINECYVRQDAGNILENQGELERILENKELPDNSLENKGLPNKTIHGRKLHGRTL